MKKVLVTGATGFVGWAVLRQLATEDKYSLVGTTRQFDIKLPAGCTTANVGELTGDTDWQSALGGVDVVVHCAARVHVLKESAANPLAAFRQVNVQGTLNLARQAVKAGVARFIFLSTVKVHGEETPPGQPFVASNEPLPMDPYAISKKEAEDSLWQIAAETGMEVVVIRPPLVYGPGVKANFLSMMEWVNKGVPLPLGAAHNKRSLVARDNLVNLIITCVDHPAAAGQTFLVSDGEDVSITELLRCIGRALSQETRLLPVPVWCLKMMATLVGKKAVAQRLCGSLQVDMTATCQTLNWWPPVTMDDALKQTAEAYRASLVKDG